MNIRALCLLLAALTIPAPVLAQHLHADMAHLPDFTKDPVNKTRIVTGVETISGPIVLENLVVNGGANLTLSGSIDLITLSTLPGSSVTLTPGTTIWYRDLPLDTDFDPDQLGHGAVTLGKIRSLGTPKTPWTRLAKEPKAGDTTVQLGMPVVGWKVGDEVVFGDSDQCATDDLIDFEVMKRCKQNHTEHRWLTAIAADGRSATLNLPLTYNHPGGWDVTGKVLALPFVSNHTRDIRFISRNPTGVRGHFMVSDIADVDIEYTEFTSGGRTCAEKKADNTVWVDGVATHIGTCQKGRYALHMHRAGRGTPVKIIGNAVNDAGVWGLAIHDTHYGTFRQNVIADAIGAGIVTEDGNETENQIDGNLVVHTIGSKGYEDDDIVGTVARHGSAFWFAGPNNYVTGNVSVDALDGFKYIIGVSSGKTQRCPVAPGADPLSATGGVDCQPNKQEIRRFDGNVTWRAMNTGVPIYQANTIDQTKIFPLTITGLECVYNHVCLRFGNIDALTLNKLMCISGYKVSTGRLDWCVRLDQNTQFTANDFEVHGTRIGFDATQPGYANIFEPNWFRLNGKKADGSLSRIDASIGATVEFDNHNQPHGSQTEGEATLRDIVMTAENTGGTEPNYFRPISRIQNGIDTTVKRKFIVFNVSINGAAPRDYEVFAPESGPDKPMPTTGDWTDPATGTTWLDVVGVPEAGLTVAQAFAKYGKAYNGGVACPTTDPKVYGYLCPQGSTPPPVPTVTSVTVTGQTAYTAVGQNAQFTATAKFSDNTTSNVTDSAAWSSSNPMIAAISSAGLLTTRAAGTATVSATAAGKVGTLAITVTVTPPTPTPIACTGTLTGTAPNGGTFKCVAGQACPVTPAGTTWICQ